MSETDESKRGLREAELAMLRDGVEHTVEALCWKANCAGSLPWVVERILTDRALAEHPPAPAEEVPGDEVEALCVLFHDAYEAAALEEGWETQERSRVPWADVPEGNKATMRATIRTVLTSDWLRDREQL